MLFRSHKFTKDATLTASLNFCGSEIISTNSISFKVGDNLEVRDNQLTYSDCIMDGGEFTVSIKSPDLGYSYAFYDSKNSLLSTTTSAVVEIPENNGEKTVVFYVEKKLGVCSQKTKIETITGNKVVPRLKNSELTVIGGEYDSENSRFLICKGENITISPVNEITNFQLTYQWTIDRIAQTETGASLSNVSFNDFDKSHTITRKTIYKSNGTVCDEITDEIIVYTRPKINIYSNLTSNAPDNTMCYNEDISDRQRTRLNSSHIQKYRMQSSS